MDNVAALVLSSIAFPN